LALQSHCQEEMTHSEKSGVDLKDDRICYVRRGLLAFYRRGVDLINHLIKLSYVIIGARISGRHPYNFRDSFARQFRGIKERLVCVD
jgi:hypothetical protein